MTFITPEGKRPSWGTTALMGAIVAVAFFCGAGLANHYNRIAPALVQVKVVYRYRPYVYPALPFTATAYARCDTPGTRTATGTRVHEGEIAVDPAVIPMNSWVLIDGRPYHVEDTGGAIQGRIVDIWFRSCGQAIAFGRRKVRLHVLN